MPTGVYKRNIKEKKRLSVMANVIGVKTRFIKGMTVRLGSKMSKGAKIKMSLVKKGKPSSFLGKKHTLKTIEKIRKNKKQWADIHKEHYKKFSIAGIVKQQTMKEPTSIEKKLYNELKRKGLLFETQKLINGKFLVDAYIPSLNLIIEADGDYWHSLERVIKKDKAENAYLTKCGYKLVRWREADINSNITNLFNQIELN